MTDPQAGRDAIHRAADYIHAAVRHAAPTAEAAASWNQRDGGDSVTLISRDMGMFMCETGKRHPVHAYGPRSEWNWVDQDVNHPDRVRACERAMYSAADEAERRFEDAYLQRIAIDSPYFHLEP